MVFDVSSAFSIFTINQFYCLQLLLSYKLFIVDVSLKYHYKAYDYQHYKSKCIF